jgi:hypothetical protein
MTNIVSSLEIMVGGWVGSFSLILFFMHSVSWLSVMVGRNPSQAMSKEKDPISVVLVNVRTCANTYSGAQMYMHGCSPPLFGTLNY